MIARQTSRGFGRLTTTLIGAAAASTLVVGAAAAPASAVPVPEAETLVLYDVSAQELLSTSSLAGIQFSLHPFGGTPTTVMTSETKDTTLRAVLSSCGEVVTERTSTLRGFDAFIYVGFGEDPRYATHRPSAISDRLGPSIDYTLTVTKPGYDPYTYTGSTSGYTTRPSCEDLAGDNSARIPVQAWSYAYAQPTAKIGSNLTISETRAAGTHVAYVWTVKAKGKPAQVVSRGYRALKVKRGWKGKQVTVTVTVTKGTGKRAKSLARTIRYGKAS